MPLNDGLRRRLLRKSGGLRHPLRSKKWNLSQKSGKGVGVRLRNEDLK
jgi:hypothetical protein